MSRLGSLLKVNLGRNKLDAIPDRWVNYFLGFENSKTLFEYIVSYTNSLSIVKRISFYHG